MSDDSEYEKDSDVAALVESLSVGDDLDLETLINQTCELLDTVFDMQEFLMEQGYTKKDFFDWKEKKDMRMYH